MNAGTIERQKLHPRPITQRAARAWVQATHRHLSAPRGDVIRLALVDDAGCIRAVGMAGRPVARMLDDGLTLEITRIASDGLANACSMLYGALRRAGVELGYQRFITYTLPEEGGASLRASGWTIDGEAGGGEWSRASRQRGTAERGDIKHRWSWIRSASSYSIKERTQVTQ